MRTSAEALLVDTHVWVWLVRGEEQLREATIAAILRSAGQGSMYLSVMSVWEIGLLEAKGRLHLDLPCLDWIQTALRRSRAVVAPLTPEIAVQANRLPDTFHNDPIDRILVATARVEGFTLLTRDRAIIDYGRRGHVRTLAC